jgi:gentisate 1,2-dioxygenase
MTTLFEITLAKARAEQERIGSAMNLITRDQALRELSPMGELRWYLHPDLQDPMPSTRALYFHELLIPSGSRSGKLQCQGGIVHFVLEGSGYTEVDGETHEWEALDAIAIPILEAGVTYQHVNTGTGDARMIVSWPNFDSALGEGAGVEMRLLESAPEFPG